MAISIQPVDGLINRLLQQHGKPSSVDRQNPPAPMARQDQLSISSSAQLSQTPSTESQIHSQNQSNSPTHHKPSERALESHLLNLYKKHDDFGG